MRRLYRSLSYLVLEVLLHLWALSTFLNFVGWMIRKRRYSGWDIGDMVWYDTVIGSTAVFVPMIASVCFMYNLLT